MNQMKKLKLQIDQKILQEMIYSNKSSILLNLMKKNISNKNRFPQIFGPTQRLTKTHLKTTISRKNSILKSKMFFKNLFLERRIAKHLQQLKIQTYGQYFSKILNRAPTTSYRPNYRF